VRTGEAEQDREMARGSMIKKEQKKREGAKTIITVMNEGGGRSPLAISQAVRWASVALTSLS